MMTSGGNVLLLTHGNEQLRLARWPNLATPANATGSGFRGYVTSAGVAPSSPTRNTIALTGLGAAGKELTSRPARWLNSRQLALHGYWEWQWVDAYMAVRRVFPSNHTIELDCDNAGCGHYWPAVPGTPFYAVDLIEELDEEGEYWQDRSSGLLFVWLPAVLTADVEVAMCCQDQTRLHKGDCGWFGSALVTLTNVSHFTLEGLRLDHVRGAGIEVDNGTNVTLHNLTVQHVTATGISIGGGHGVVVSRCTVKDVGEGGVHLSGGDRATLTPSGHRLLDSTISHFQRWHFTENAGVSVMGVGVKVLHNEIFEGRHYAICPAGNDHLIAGNLIHDVITETWDAGALDYGRDITHRGNVLRDNVFHTLGRPQHYPCAGTLYPMAKTEKACLQTAVYFDDHYSGWTVFGNAFAGVQVGAFIHFGRWNNFTNNVFTDVGIALAIEGGGEFSGAQLLPGITAASAFPAWQSGEYFRQYPALRTLMSLPSAHSSPGFNASCLGTMPSGFNGNCSFCAPYNNTIDGNLAAGYTGISALWQLNNSLGEGWMKGSTVNAAMTEPQRNWNDSDATHAGFVHADPVSALDFRLQPGSQARQTLGPTWRDIKLGQGPRPEGAVVMKSDDLDQGPGLSTSVPTKFKPDDAHVPSQATITFRQPHVVEGGRTEPDSMHTLIEAGSTSVLMTAGQNGACKAIAPKPWWPEAGGCYQFTCHSSPGPIVPGGTALYPNYITAMSFLHSSGAVEQWNDESATAHFEFDLDSGNGTKVPLQAWFDNAKSLGLKYSYAKEAGVQGVAMWTANSIDNSNATQVSEFWGAVRNQRKFTDGTSKRVHLKSDDRTRPK
jgi:hypothetical protein